MFSKKLEVLNCMTTCNRIIIMSNPSSVFRPTTIDHNYYLSLKAKVGRVDLYLGWWWLLLHWGLKISLDITVLHAFAKRPYRHYPSPLDHAWALRNRTATAGSDVVQSGRPIFDDFFQHLWWYIGNNTANVVFQMVKRLWLIRIDQ
ncbi:hypothetical protein TNCV_4356751 [Trichonephila clavipes]|nr:hypothetical protein TNCV_4356751 [Trichonephila clavipes]